MNRTQLKVLWVGIGIFVLMGLFPPHTGRFGEDIDVGALCVRWVILAVVTGGLIYSLKVEPELLQKVLKMWRDPELKLKIVSFYSYLDGVGQRSYREILEDARAKKRKMQGGERTEESNTLLRSYRQNTANSVAGREMLATNEALPVTEIPTVTKSTLRRNNKQKKVLRGQIARWFGIAVCILAIPPMAEDLSKTHSLTRFLFLSLGTFSLVAYGVSLLFKKKQFARTFLLCCVSYCFIQDFVYGGFGLSSKAIPGDIGLLFRFAIECILLLVGYWGLPDSGGIEN